MKRYQSITHKALKLIFLLVPGLVMANTTSIVKRPDVGYQGPTSEQIAALPLIATIQASGNADTDVKNFQDAIDAASEANGGRIVVSAGKYQIQDVTIKSNVHLLFKEGVEITPRLNRDSTKTQLMFSIGRLENEDITNVTFIGEGDSTHRPLFIHSRHIATQCRSFTIGKVTNLYIQNFSVSDDQTKYSTISFNLRKNGTTKNDRAKNITIKDVSINDASYGYGLVQANAGKNLLFTNLICSGGVAARIETDNRTSQSAFGVNNVVVENVTSIKGKAAVFLQPHTIPNGDVFIDGAHSIASQMSVEIRPGFEDTEGTGRFGENSTIKNVTAVYSLEATVAFASKSCLPNCLLPYFIDEVPIDDENTGVRKGPSVCAIGDFTQQISIDVHSVSASIIEGETNPDNSLEARKLIINQNAYRGNDPAKQCGSGAYENSTSAGQIPASRTGFLFPNPATQRLFIKQDADFDVINVRISDMNAKTIYSSSAVNGSGINISALPKGLYIVRVQDSEGQIHLDKFCKNRL